MKRQVDLKQSSFESGPRTGLTLIELIIIIAILAFLAALLLPAVQQARGASRRLHCKNNLRQVSMALTAVAETKLHYPATGYFGTVGGSYHSWVVTILPWIDQTAIYDKWDFDQPYNTPGNLDLATTHIPVLVCPDDQTVADEGDLSFVVNGGFGWTGPPCGVVSPSTYSPIDLNGSGFCNVNPVDGEPSDFELMYRTGLMFPENWPQASAGIKRHRAGAIRDGASQTIMMTENIHTGFDPNVEYSGYNPHGEPGNWGNPLSWRNSFFISGHVCQGLKCAPGTVDFKRANDRTQAPYQFEAINSSFQIEGAAPWPTSYHAGGVNVAFCDGSVRFVNENLDGRTYVSLVTPDGSAIEGPLAQSPIISNDY